MIRHELYKSDILSVSSYIAWSHESTKDKVNVMEPYSLLEHNCHKQSRESVMELKQNAAQISVT
jgi:hypothetical protein